MNLKEAINNDSTAKKKYDYYRSFGYRKKVSGTLALLTYGDVCLSDLIKDLGNKNTFDKLYDWLSKAKGDNPLEAIVKRYEKRHKKGGKLSDLLDSEDGYYGDDYIEEEDSCETSPEVPSGSASESSQVFMAKESAKTMNAFRCPAPVATRGVFSLSFMEEMATDAYETIEEHGMRETVFSPTSTFRMTTNTASVGIVLNQIRTGRRVDMSHVRLEELLNYFEYNEEPPEDTKFRINTELMAKNDDRKMLYIHVGARAEEKSGQNIVILLDVSGSMECNRETTQEALATIVSKLKAGDTISLVTYASIDSTVFEGFEINSDADKEQVLGKILGVNIEGFTFGSAGIETAYKIGAKYYDEKKNNQVILITDGDLNFGITEKNGLENLIEEKKKSNLFLSVIGTGLFNYKDDKLEALSKHGNGTYCVVNSLEDVEESINRRFISLTNIVAKDVKAQVEFNPGVVKRYRLLGFENRSLNHEDFKNDKVISEPYGSGGYCVALYELEMGRADAKSGLKYQTPVYGDLDEICTVKVRFKEPLSDKSDEVSKTVSQDENGSANSELARYLYCLGEKLRGSDMLDSMDEKYFRDKRENDSYLEHAISERNAEALRELTDSLGEGNRVQQNSL